MVENGTTPFYPDSELIFTGSKTKVYVSKTKNCIIKEYPIKHDEIDILKNLNHANIIQFFEYFTYKTNIYIIQEYASRGDLRNFAEHFPHRRIPDFFVCNKIIYSVVLGLQYIHGLSYIHRDIKPENILVTQNYSIKIADFGLAINKKDTIPNTRVGTLEFMAPEIINLRYDYNKVCKYDEKVDIWALGCVIYELLYGFSPFFDINEKFIQYRIVNCKFKFYPDIVNISSLSSCFILDTLEKNVTKRLSATELINKYWCGGDYQEFVVNDKIMHHLTVNIDRPQKTLTKRHTIPIVDKKRCCCF